MGLPTTSADETNMSPMVHEKFNEPDADRIIISSDNITFHLHSKFLQVYAAESVLATFQPSPPAAESSLKIPEPAKILEILFEFVFPRRYPSLARLDFETLIQLAQAAEKYKIFSAMSTCEMPLTTYISSHPAEILTYGVINNYPDAVNEAALHLIRRQKPLDEILDDIPGNARIAWVRYAEAWKLIFEEPRQLFLTPQITCALCLGVLLMWLKEMEGMPLGDIKAQKGLSGACKNNLRSCNSCTSGLTSLDRPNYKTIGEDVMRAIHSGLDSMPGFMVFVAVKDAPSLLMKFAIRNTRMLSEGNNGEMYASHPGRNLE